MPLCLGRKTAKWKQSLFRCFVFWRLSLTTTWWPSTSSSLTWRSQKKRNTGMTKFWFYALTWVYRDSTFVKVLRYKSEGRWFDTRWCHSFWSHYCPGVDSSSNRNEYQEYFLGVNAAGAQGWQPYHHPVPLSRYLGTLISWSPLGHSRPVTGLLYLLIET
jgi:hypothetical protein